MNGRELEVFAALTIFSGTLVLGLDQYPIQPVSKHVIRVEDAGGPSGSQEAISGIPPIDARDNSRMDNRQSSSWQDLGMSRGRPAGPVTSPQPGPIEYDARRDNSRYDAGLLTPVPSSVNTGR
jgi:hypothetical protein